MIPIPAKGRRLEIASYAIGRGVPGILGLLTTALLARNLAVAQYGVYATSYAGVMFANMLYFHWVRVVALRDVASGAGANEAGSYGFAYIASSAALLVSSAPLLLLQSSAEMRVLVTLALVAAASHAAFDHGLTVSQASGRHVRYALQSVIRGLLYLTLAAAAARTAFGAAGVLVSLIIALASTAAIFRLTAQPRATTGAPGKLREQFRYGYPLAASLVVSYALPFVDRWLVLQVSGPTAAAGLAGASDLTRQSIVVPIVAVALTVLPTAFKLRSLGLHADMRVHLSRSWVLLLGVSAPLVGGLTALSNELSSLVLGANVSSLAAPLIPAIAFASLAESLKHHYFDGAFALRGSQRTLVGVLITSLAVGAALRIALIPGLGATGAAYSSLIQYAVSLVLTLALTPRHSKLPIPAFETILIIASTVLMMIAIRAVPSRAGIIGTGITVCFGATIYAILVSAGIFSKRRLQHSRGS